MQFQLHAVRHTSQSHFNCSLSVQFTHSARKQGCGKNASQRLVYTYCTVHPLRCMKFHSCVFRAEDWNNITTFDYGDLNVAGCGWDAVLPWHLSRVCSGYMHQGRLRWQAGLWQEVWQMWCVWWGQPELQEDLRDVHKACVSIQAS